MPSGFPRRERRTLDEQQATVERRMTRGVLGGRSSLIAPVAQRRPAPPSTRGSNGGPQVQFGHDSVVFPSNLTLNYVPDLPSLHVYLDGVEQQEGVDWTFDAGSNTVVPQTVMDARTGDLLDARYAYFGPLLFPEVSFVSASAGENAGSSRTHPFGGTAVIGSLIVVAAQEDNSGTFTVPAGYTKIADEHTFFNHLAVFVKTSDGTETGVTVATSGANRVAVCVAFYDRGAVTQFAGSVGGVGTTYNFPTVPVASGKTRIVECVVGQQSVTGLSLGSGNVIPDAIFRTGTRSGTTAVAIYDFVPGGSGTSPAQSTSFAADRWCGATVAVD